MAGIEIEGQPDQPLRVRYIEPQSSAAAQGLLRGEQILSVNGRPASELVANDDFGVLTPDNPGDLLQLEVRGSGGDRSVTLTAAVYALTPVTNARVITTPQGRRMGYVVVKDMIDQVDSPLDAAFRSFRAEGVTEVVLDLRYNGGGFVSTGGNVASYVGGNRSSGQPYAQLLYNDQQANLNQTFRFSNPSAALGLARVYVLTGPRTCSASEQVINGLSPFVQVVQIGDTTCGKPVGFLSQDGGCGQQYSVVNFESTNALNQGRYFDGLAPPVRWPTTWIIRWVPPTSACSPPRSSTPTLVPVPPARGGRNHWRRGSAVGGCTSRAKTRTCTHAEGAAPQRRRNASG